MKKHKVAINLSYGAFSLSNKAIHWLNEKYGIEFKKSCYSNTLYIDTMLERHDKRLIECIETLGSKDASGEYSNIVIVEIDSDKYYISEYDGLETIYTPDKIEWITIK